MAVTQFDTGAALAAPPDNPHWIGTWASSPQPGDPGNAPPAPGFTDMTLRQIVHVSIGGKRLRLRFSNTFGSVPLTLTAAHIALSAGGSAIHQETDRALTFGGQLVATIPAGASLYSDPIDFTLAPLSDIAVTIHTDTAPPEITTHPGARCTSYLQSGAPVSAVELPAEAKVLHWYFLNGIDVVATRSSATVSVLGDSITDGRDSITDGNGRWTDYLARRLQADPRTAEIGVLNAGIGGNRVLRDGLGPSALSRLDRDVLDQNGVRWLVVLEGINDIGTHPHSETGTTDIADEVIAGYRQILRRAHAKSLRVYGATILPFEGSSYFTAEREAARQKINEWIRAAGEFDAVIDMDAAMRDPQHTTRLLAAVDGGDHLHPGDAGYRTMADAVDRKLFER